jgi:hypothetical protein
MSQLLLGSVQIRQDIDGRYCLNDLHKAAGNLSRHKPSNWTRQSEDLIMEATSFSNKESLKRILGKGKAQGTYVTRELVYAYATWLTSCILPKGTQSLRQPRNVTTRCHKVTYRTLISSMPTVGGLAHALT